MFVNNPQPLWITAGAFTAHSDFEGILHVINVEGEFVDKKAERDRQSLDAGFQCAGYQQK